jgi:hypothetical protein
MHRRPPSKEQKGQIVLPSEVYKALLRLAEKEEMSVEAVVSRFFLLGFISFDKPLYILEDGLYKQILYEEPRP